MKGVTDLRDDLKSYHSAYQESFKRVESKLDALSDRLTVIEVKIMRLLWVTSAVGATLVFLWGGYELLTTFFDVNVSVTTKPVE